MEPEDQPVGVGVVVVVGNSQDEGASLAAALDRLRATSERWSLAASWRRGGGGARRAGRGFAAAQRRTTWGHREKHCRDDSGEDGFTPDHHSPACGTVLRDGARASVSVNMSLNQSSHTCGTGVIGGHDGRTWSFTAPCRVRPCRWVVVRRSKSELCRGRQGAARSSKVTGGDPMPFAGAYRVFPSGNIVKISIAAGLFFLFVSRFDKGLGRLRRMGSEPVSPHRRLSWPLSQAAGESEEDALCRAR